MKGGEVTTLVILGGNPVFDAPADLDFASAMAKVPHTIALGHTIDETSSKAEWHIPRAHYLESWGDTRAVGGTLSVVQPLILPLFGGRTAVEVLGLMAGEQGTARATTSCGRPGNRSWARSSSTRSGIASFTTELLAGSELPEVVPDLAAQRQAELARSIGSAALVDLAMASRSSSSPRRRLHDGRFANNGWLQELPDPLTKLTWDNPALVSPKTAETLGLASEGCRSSRARGPLSRAAGLGSTGDGGWRGRVDARLRAFARGSGRLGRRVRHVHGPALQSDRLRQRRHAHQASATTYPLSSTQHHGSMEGRPLVRESIAVRAFGRNRPQRRQNEAMGRMPPIPHASRRREAFPARSGSSRSTRSTSPSGRSMPTTRATSGG